MRKLRHWPKFTQVIRGKPEPKYSNSYTVIFNIIVINKNNNTERIPVPNVEGIALPSDSPQIPFMFMLMFILSPCFISRF